MSYYGWSHESHPGARHTRTRRCKMTRLAASYLPSTGLSTDECTNRAAARDAMQCSGWEFNAVVPRGAERVPR